MPALDAFILFNEKEKAVERIVERLEGMGVTTYFWRSDISIGEKWNKVEQDKLREARTVVVFLGDLGWGPTHLALAEQAQSLEKRIIPVKIGDPPPDSFNEAHALFRDQRYVDLGNGDDESLKQLADAILKSEGEPGATDDFNEIVNALVDGDEAKRAEILRRIQTSASLDKPGLAARLRQEIRERFSAEHERSSPSDSSDSRKLRSIRSWMLSSLIWADPEQAENRDLILAHVQREREPEHVVRFWVLAGLHQVDATYKSEAVDFCLSDEAPEVSALARAISDSSDRNLISEFRNQLLSPEFEIAWPVLRVLRIVPIPELAVDVLQQFSRSEPDVPLAYDSLYALCQPSMAREAAKRLIDSALHDVVVRVILVARASKANVNAVRNFAVFLAACPNSEVDATLGQAEQEEGVRSTAQLLRLFLREYRNRETNNQLFIPGFDSDAIDVTKDPLDIREDVQTLTAVMLAGEVKPPLAIGLFGDWGSGKSYFMQSMIAAARGLAERARKESKSKFCSHIVQIEFNAWHYVDTNLWASLVSYILECLAAYVNPQVTPEEQQAALVKELGSAKAAVTEVEAEKKNTNALVKSREKELQDLQTERQQKEIRLSDLRASDLQTLLLAHPSVKEKLDASLEELGIPGVINDAKDLSRVVSEAYTVRGRVTALLVALTKPKNRWLVIGLLLLVLLGAPLVALALHELKASEFMVRLTALTAQAVAIITAAAAFLRKALEHVKTGVSKIEEAKRRVDEVLAAKRRHVSEEEMKLQSEIASLKAQEEGAASKLSAAKARVLELEERIKSLKEGRSLAYFLAERSRSEDYRKHLGLISTIRQDFKSLGERLDPAKTNLGDNLRPVQRIILYIDDLDRVPAEKVMDVLQAVHLLLAYPLFVVVVGVDPRWLLHSLGSTYTAFQSDGRRFRRDAKVWRTTPQNYLEKIFQIPFSLRPMSPAGFGKLMGGLLTPSPRRETTKVPDKKEAGAKPPPGPGEQGPSHSSGGAPAPDRGASGQSPTALEKEPEFVINEDSLTIHEWEGTFAQKLFDVIATPRAAKRFSNIYRILKAPIRPEQLGQFEGSAEAFGEFQLPMLLLAFLIAQPAEAAIVFPKLYQHAGEGKDICASMSLLKREEPSLTPVLERLDPIIGSKTFPGGCLLLVQWIPRVSRFSFEVGRAIQKMTPTVKSGSS